VEVTQTGAQPSLFRAIFKGDALMFKGSSFSDAEMTAAGVPDVIQAALGYGGDGTGAVESSTPRAGGASSEAAPACLTAREYLEIFEADSPDRRATSVEVDFCVQGWAVTTFRDDPGKNLFPAIFQWVGGEWKTADKRVACEDASMPAQIKNRGCAG